AENVRDYKDFVPTLVKNQICIRRRGAVGAFGEDAALELAGIFAGNHAIDCRWYKNVAWQSKKLVRVNMMALIKRTQVALLQHVLFGRFHVDSFGIVNRSVR